MPRHWIALALVAFAVCVSPRVSGAQPLPYSAFEQITVDNTVGGVAFTATKITPTTTNVQATLASCTLETADIRFTIDGTAPTATVGNRWFTGASMVFAGHDVLDRFRAIRVAGSSGVLNCTYTASSLLPGMAPITAGLSPASSVSGVSVASNGLTGATAPSSADFIGAKDGGGNLAGLNVDAGGRLIVDCGTGCSGASDTVGTPVALNALNAAASVALSAEGGAGVLVAAGTLAGTVTPELSFDGGTTWVATLFFNPADQTTAATLVFTNPNVATQRTIFVTGGASNARVRVSSFTSGTATGTVRSTQNAGSTFATLTAGSTVTANAGSGTFTVGGTVTSNAGSGNFTVVQGTAANLKVDLSGTGANATALKTDGSAVTQPVSGTVTANAGTNLNTSLLALESGGNLAAAAGGIGAAADGAVGDGSGSIAAHTRQIAKLFANVTFGDVNNAAAATGLLNVIDVSRYNATQPTLTDGRWSSTQLSSRGEVLIAKGVSGFSIDNTTFTATQATGTNLHMVCDSGCSTSTAPADEAAFAAGTTPQSPVGGFFQTTATNNALTTGQMGAFQLTSTRALFTNLRNAAGTEVGTSSTPLQVTLANTGANATAVKVDGSAVTQPISAASLPLPALAATSTKQSDGTQKTQIVDGSGNVIASTSNNLNVQCANCSGSGASAADGASVVEGTSTFAPIGGEFQTTPGTVAAGKQAMAAITAHRALQVSLFDTAGTAITSPTIATTNTTSQATGTPDFCNASAATPTAVGADGRNIAFWCDTVGRQRIDFSTVQGTAVDVNSGNKSAGTIRVVLATDQPALTNKLLVTPDSVALPANQSVNVNQLAGTGTDTNSGNKSAGTLRVVLATDQPALTNKLLVTPDANSSVNVAQIGGASTSTAASGVQKVGIVGNAGAVFDAAGQNVASPANELLIGGQFNTTPTTITTGNVSPLQLDNAGNLLVNIKAGAGSGGTALQDTGTFTQGSTNFTPSGGFYNSSITNLASGQGGAAALTPSRSFHVTFYDTSGNAVTPSTDGTVGTTAMTTGPHILGYASSTTPAAVTSGQDQGFWLDTVGRVHTVCDSGCSGTTLGQTNGSNSLPVVTAYDDPTLFWLRQIYAATLTNQRLSGSLSKSTGLGSSILDVRMRAPMPVSDPCQDVTKRQQVAISQTTSTVLFTGATGLGGRVVFCNVLAVGADAENLSLVEGSGSTCATNTNAIIGGTTAANGPNFAANAGWVEGNGGATIAFTKTPGNDVCLLQSGAGRVAGHLTYAYIPQ